jgi:hypothetical protein
MLPPIFLPLILSLFHQLGRGKADLVQYPVMDDGTEKLVHGRN